MPQVKNIGDTEVKIVMVEPLPACKPCETPGDFTSAFKAAPECYKARHT